MKLTHGAKIYIPLRYSHPPTRYEVRRCLYTSALAHNTECTNYVLFLRLCYLIPILIAGLTPRVENMQCIVITWHVF
jgi:hypothetical protein